MTNIPLYGVNGMKRIFFVFLVFVLAIGIIVVVYNSNDDKFDSHDEIAAIINGEHIYVSDINRILEEYKDNENISFESILNNSIDELLIVQYGKRIGIEASVNEIDERLSYFKNSFHDKYIELLESGNLDKYRDNLENLIVYDKTIENVLSQCDDRITVDENEALSWYKENIDTDLTNFSKHKDMIVEKLQDEKKRQVIEEFVIKLKEVGEVKIY